MKKKKIIIVVIISILIVITVILYKKQKNKSLNSDSSTNNPGSSTSKTTVSSFPLKSGSSGDKVKTLQQCINYVTPTPFIPLNIDGKFGSKTLSALQSYVGLTQVTEKQYNKLRELAVPGRVYLGKTLTLTDSEKYQIKYA